MEAATARRRSIFFMMRNFGFSASDELWMTLFESCEKSLSFTQQMALEKVESADSMDGVRSIEVLDLSALTDAELVV